MSEIVDQRTGRKAFGFHEITVIQGSARRRRWSLEEKARIVAESLDPAVSASAVARRHGINPNQLFVWRKALARERAAAGMAARGADGPCQPGTGLEPMLEVVVGSMTVRLSAELPAPRLRRILEVLRGLQ